nr:hypothetical protein [Tanacetum cinerariifolium]
MKPWGVGGLKENAKDFSSSLGSSLVENGSWPVAPPSPDYVPGPDHLPYPDYVPSPKHSPSSVEIPYVPEPEYPELCGILDLEEDLGEDPEDDQAYYLTDGGDGDDEPFDDENNDDDTDFDPDEDPEEEPFKDEEDDEEEHLASVDSSAVPIVDLVLPARDIEALEADEPTPIPRSSIIIPLSQTRPCRARKTVRPEPSMSASVS